MAGKDSNSRSSAATVGSQAVALTSSAACQSLNKNKRRAHGRAKDRHKLDHARQRIWSLEAQVEHAASLDESLDFELVSRSAARRVASATALAAALAHGASADQSEDIAAQVRQSIMDLATIQRGRSPATASTDTSASEAAAERHDIFDADDVLWRQPGLPSNADAAAGSFASAGPSLVLHHPAHRPHEGNGGGTSRTTLSTPGSSSPGSQSSAAGSVFFAATLKNRENDSSYSDPTYEDGAPQEQRGSLCWHPGDEAVASSAPGFSARPGPLTRTAGSIGERASITTSSTSTLTRCEDGHAPVAGVNAVAAATQCGPLSVVSAADISSPDFEPLFGFGSDLRSTPGKFSWLPKPRYEDYDVVLMNNELADLTLQLEGAEGIEMRAIITRMGQLARLGTPKAWSRP